TSSLFSPLPRRPPRPPLLLYTTLFRSYLRAAAAGQHHRQDAGGEIADLSHAARAAQVAASAQGTVHQEHQPAARCRQAAQDPTRSEEHTSELQSREKLVCRLLLEKKND